MAAVKLVSGKVTFVHRRLWPALFCVATVHEAWQMNRLSKTARRTLELVGQKGRLGMTELKTPLRLTSNVAGAAVRELEPRLLVYSQSVHAPTGAHIKVLESWDGWAQRVGIAPAWMSPSQAKKALEEALAGLINRDDACSLLPWR